MSSVEINHPCETSIRLGGQGIVAILLLGGLVVSGLSGVFEPRDENVSASTETFDAVLEYPRIMQLGKGENLELSLSNKSPIALENVKVQLSPALLRGITLDAAFPSIQSDGSIQLPPVKARETSTVILQITPQDAGGRGAAFEIEGPAGKVELPFYLRILP